MKKKYLSFLTNQQAQKWADKLVPTFAKFPHLPKKITDFLVKFAPYLIIVAAVGQLISGLQDLLNLNHGAYLLANLFKINRTYYYVSGVFELVIGLIYLFAYDGFKNKQYQGWMLIFWATILGVVQELVLLFLGWNSLFAIILSALISLYVIYEIRPAYLPKKTKTKKSSTKKVTSKAKSKTKSKK